MAEKTLRLIFENTTNDKKSVMIPVPLCDDTKSGGSIRTSMDAIHANKGIFSLDMGSPKAAAFVTPMVLTYVDINE